MRFAIDNEEMISRERFFTTQILPEMGTYKPGKRQAVRRETELHGILSWLSLIHFGVRPTAEIASVLNKGCYLADQFFFTEWWTAHPLDFAALNRSEGNSDFEWFKPYRTALLLASIQGEKALVSKLAGWPASWMKAEWRAVEFQVGIEQFYFEVLNELGLSRLKVEFDRIEDSRIKRLSDAIASLDRERIAKTIGETVREFSKGLPQQGLLPYQAIAIEETIVVHLWSIFRGMDLRTDLSEEVKVHILAVR